MIPNPNLPKTIEKLEQLISERLKIALSNLRSIHSGIPLVANCGTPIVEIVEPPKEEAVYLVVYRVAVLT